MKKIDFDYAFAAPHTITLCRPSSSYKIITDTSKTGIAFYWTFKGPEFDYPISETVHPIDVRMIMDVTVDNTAAPLSKWYRHESSAPYLFAEGKKKNVDYVISAIACKSGVIVKTELKNNSKTEKDVHVRLANEISWCLGNLAWVDGVNSNVLIKGNGGRADRLLAIAFGADDYPLYYWQDEETKPIPPLVDGKYKHEYQSGKKVTCHYKLDAGETKTGYFLIPYEKAAEDVDELKKTDLEGEMTDALNEWKRLLARGAKIDIADKALLHAYYSCIADIFVLREKIGKNYMGITNGSNRYRSVNSGEPLETELLLDTIGYTKEAVDDYRLYFEAQEKDGCWASRKGWENTGWGVAFNKANVIMEHYYMTLDRDFLEKNYKRMYDSTMFQYRTRQSTKNAPVKAERGLMTRGIGDCGMMNGKDNFGVFYPTNCGSVAADAKTLEAAKILGKTEDIELLTNIYEDAKNDLLTSINDNLVSYGDYVMMPAIPNAPLSSIYGCTHPYFPCKLVEADDPMIKGAMQYIESKSMSEGGLPLGTGWMKDGIWVAIALGSIARTYLRMGMYKDARKFIYPAINHASPYVTYCEERGGEKNSKKQSGDKQHLWTPLSVGQYMTDAMYFEDDNAVHLLAGALPEWLLEGKKISVKGLKTHYGNLNFVVTYKNGEFTLKMKTDRVIEKDILLHLPKGEEVEDIKISADGKTEITCMVTL